MKSPFKKYSVLFILLLTAMCIVNPKASADEASCRHLFHDHSADTYRVRFLLSEPKQQGIFIQALLASPSTPSFLEISRYKRSTNYSSFEKKYLIDPIYNLLYRKVGFFTERSLLYTVVKDVNGETWAILVTQQVSTNVKKDVALFKIDYVQSKNKKAPVLIKTFLDSSIL